METQEIYKSFNSNKSLNELLYKMKAEALRLNDLKFELQFYITLLYKPIFKTRTANLYEILARYKYDIGILQERRVKLQSHVNEYINQINNKIENEITTFDDYFINNYDDLEHEIFNFHNKVSNFKFGFFEYIQNVSLN